MNNEQMLKMIYQEIKNCNFPNDNYSHIMDLIFEYDSYDFFFQFRKLVEFDESLYSDSDRYTLLDKALQIYFGY